MDFQALYDALMRRQAARREANLPPLRPLEEMTNAILNAYTAAYEAAIEPHLPLRRAIYEAAHEAFRDQYTGRVLAYRVRRASDRLFDREMASIGVVKPSSKHAYALAQSWLRDRAA